MKLVKVMIVDDHLVVREGLKKLLGLEEDIEIVGEASSGLECLELMESLSPDIIFMDIRMPGIDGIETTRLVCEKDPDVKVIMLTIYDDGQYVTEAIQAGAKGYVLKKVGREELTNVIHHVAENGAFLDPSVTADLLDKVKESEEGSKEKTRAKLTQRELEVLKGIVAGQTERLIAKDLCISYHTVRSHTKNIYRKLRVSTRSQAVGRALRDKLINVES